MIREDLLEFQYYLDRLSKFMQESYGINEQVETFHALLKQVDNFYDQFLTDANIFNSYNVYQNHNLILDKLGELFNCYRHFTIPKYDPANWGVILGYLDITLEDDDFLIYIKAQIIKQNFNGTREQLQSLYTTYQEGELKEGILNLIFYYLQSPLNNSAECYIYWSQDKEYSESLQELFLNGYLTIESMGILYHRSLADISNFEAFAISTQESGNPPYTPPFTPVNPKKYNYFAYKGYELLSTKPDDWDDSNPQENYYQLTITAVTPSSPVPDWEENKYYELDTGKYVLLLAKPSDWDNLYTNYYTIQSAAAPATWTANTYYKKVELGGQLA